MYQKRKINKLKENQNRQIGLNSFLFFIYKKKNIEKKKEITKSNKVEWE